MPGATGGIACLEPREVLHVWSHGRSCMSGATGGLACLEPREVLHVWSHGRSCMSGATGGIACCSKLCQMGVVPVETSVEASMSE